MARFRYCVTWTDRNGNKREEQFTIAKEAMSLAIMMAEIYCTDINIQVQPWRMS